jgi:CHAT domain-containing protein
MGEGAENGVLTALEISRLNFSAAELVMLSACEAASGDISTAEGVSGLQGSFLSAELLRV